MAYIATMFSFYLLRPISTQYEQIWFDPMEVNDGWSKQGNMIAFAVYSSACFDNPCTKISKTSSISKATDISQYTYIQLQLDISADNMDTDETCAAYYAYDIKADTQFIRSYHGVFKDIRLYPQQKFNLPLSASSHTIWIFLQSHNTNNGACYWDNAYLFGIPVTNPPTANPTYIPTTQLPTNTLSATANPTYLPPTLFPTTNPTYSPIMLPTNYPTNTHIATTNPPSVSPTKSPTNFPTFYPTKFPMNFPTFYPTNLPPFSTTQSPINLLTFQPSIEPTMEPTSILTLIPTDVTLINNTLSLHFESTELTRTKTTTSTTLRDKIPVIFINWRYIYKHYMLYIVGALALITCCCITCAVITCCAFRKKEDAKNTVQIDRNLAMELSVYTPGGKFSLLSNRSKKKTLTTSVYTLEGPKGGHHGIHLPQDPTISSNRNPVLLKDIMGSFRPEYAIEVIPESDDDDSDNDDSDTRPRKRVKRTISTSNASMYESQSHNKPDKLTSAGRDPELHVDTMDINLGEDNDGDENYNDNHHNDDEYLTIN